MQLFLLSFPLPHTTFKSVNCIASASSVSAAPLIQILIIVIWTPLVICIDVPVSSLYLLPVDHSSAPRGCARIVKLIFFSPCSHSSLVPPLPLAALETTLYGIFNFVSYCCSVAKSCPALCDPWTSAQQSPLFFTVSQSLLRFMSIELVMLFNHLVLCRLLLPLPSVFSSIKVFSNESALHLRWPKYWSFSFSISPSNEYSGLISFMID